MTGGTATATGPSNGAARLTAPTIAQYLESERGLDPGKRRVVLLRAVPVWDGPDRLSWGGGRQAAVAAAPSPLAVYELVLNHRNPNPAAPGPAAPGPDVLVVLTDREEAELGADLLAAVHRQRVKAIETWDLVRAAFGAGSLDHWLTEETWAAEALLDAAPPRGGWPRVAGGALSRRDALTALALRRLGIGRYDPDAEDTPAEPGRGGAAGGDEADAHTLLRWSLVPGGPERLLALRAPERAGLAAFVGEEEQAGPTGRALVALVAADHGPDAVAFGLVCAALWVHADAGEADAEVNRARGRAERWFGEELPARGADLDALAAAFGRACEEFVSALLVTGRSNDEETAAGARRLHGAVLDRAAAVARQLGAERAAETSPVLPAGLEARFVAAGEALLGGAPERVGPAVRAVRDHRLAADEDAAIRIRRVRMAQRLAQWLATDPPVETTTVADAIGRHVAETGWADLALEHVASGGDPAAALRSAYASVCGAARERRRDIDRHFARTLAARSPSDRGPGEMLTVETFLPRVVAPVVEDGRRRVLLLVVDGMNAAIAAEFGEELRDHWVEYDPLPRAKGMPRRRAVAAALPTITAVSRASLFAAALTTGTQADEKRLLPAHPWWHGADVAVFHQDELRAGSGGEPFGPDLHAALVDDQTHVAVVLDTVDDRLAHERQQGDGGWRLSDIGGLRPLLRAAAAQGRAVLVTSGHGHVVERGSTLIDAADVRSARHRGPAGGPVAEQEVALTGPRVLDPVAGTEPGEGIVALWDADARYASPEVGYHGGAALAEFAVPVLALLPYGAQPPPGWRELGSQRPPWWSLATPVPDPPSGVRATAEVAPPRKPARRAKEKAELAGSHDALFDVAVVPAQGEGGDALLAVAPVSPDDALVDALLKSEVFAAQVDVITTRRPDLPRVAKALHALLDAGGTLPVTALAQWVDLPASRRADGFAAVLRQLLNYDGVQVLETLPDGRTLRLHVRLLREQFELD